MLEREVENLLEQKLRLLDWVVDVGDPNRQVYRQGPRTQEEKERLRINGFTKFPDFILYANNRKDPIAIIETKRTEYKNLEEAKEQGLRYANALKAKFLFLYNANRVISYYVPTQENLFINDNELNELIDLGTLEKFRSNRIDTDNKAEIKSKSDLINIFKIANNKLREAGISIGISRFTEFSNLLFLKLISELNIERNYNLPKNLLWDTYKDMEDEALLSYINNTVITGFNKRFDCELFTQLKITDTTKLKEIVEKLESVDLAKIDTDIKGDAFEYFIQKYNQGNNDLGEYFTPRHIVRFLNDIAKPIFGEKVYDPFCGTGGMLIVAFERMKQELINKNIFNEDNLNKLREKSIYGGEISDTSRITKMNMILSGDGHSNIEQQNSFGTPVSSKYNVVMSNIPFNMDVTDKQAELYQPIIKNGNAVAILHMLKSLENNPNSRACVIVPDAVLNDTSMKDLREHIVRTGKLIGIISLPCGVFMPYTEAKTSILILRKNPPKTQSVFFYKVRNDGFTLTTRRRPKSGINDLDEFISLHEKMLDCMYCDEIGSDKLTYIKRKKILDDGNNSLLLINYISKKKSGYISLDEVLEKVKEENSEGYKTASITKSQIWGMPLGEELWGENFYSVTSTSNLKYSVVDQKWISYNPARANIGSFGINMSKNKLSVSSAYPVFKTKDETRFIPEYVYLEIRYNQEVKEEIAERSYGTIRQNLPPQEFLKIQIRDIGIEEQKRIVKDFVCKYNRYKKLEDDLLNFKII